MPLHLALLNILPDPLLELRLRVLEVLVDFEAGGWDVVIEVVEIFDDAIAPGRPCLSAHGAIERGRACAPQLGLVVLLEKVDCSHLIKLIAPSNCIISPSPPIPNSSFRIRQYKVW